MFGRVLRDSDPYLLLSVMVLTASGLLLIFSAGEGSQSTATADLYARQAIWWTVAAATGAVAFSIPLKWWEVMAYPLYFIGLCLLTILALNRDGGSTAARWIRVGSIQVQPAEFAKVFTIMAMARYLGNRKGPVESFRGLVIPSLIALIPAALTALQPDLGTAMVFIAILLGALFWSGIPATHLFFLIVPVLSLLTAFNSMIWGIFTASLVFFLAWRRTYLFDSILIMSVNIATGLMTVPLWERLKPYQRERIVGFLRPQTDPLGSGWQIIQSKVAIGSGGLMGKGFLKGTQKKLAFLPAQHTDFIFSILGEEFGYIGVLFLLGLFLWILLRIVELARSVYSNSFSTLLAFGVFVIWFFHFFINVGMALGVMPVTGLPLPFVSYGGSFLVACYFSLGILLRISSERFNYWAR